jgi:CRISPR/Cas system-associated exonuclease Cas4 (RecB family)
VKLRRRLRDERGLTATELSVTMLVLALVVLFVTQSLISVQNTVAGESHRLENLGEARTLMNVMSKDIRTATVLSADSSPFEVAAPTRVEFYANLNTTTLPNLVEIRIDGSNPSAPVLVERVTPPEDDCVDGTEALSPLCYNEEPPDVRLVGRYVTNTDAEPLFTYFNVDGLPVGIPGQTLTDDQSLEVRQVGITLSVRKSTSLAVPSTDLVNRVRLPNVYYTVPAP